MPDNTDITNIYDADGHRVEQSINSQVTKYLWDETSLYGDVVLETSNGNNTSYVLAGNKLISQSHNGAASYYLQDGQGSTRTLTNSAGSVTDTYDYTAFGEIYDQSGATENKYLYTGQQYDAQTELYSLRTRYYAPGIGRFLSQDTYAVNFSNPIELNRYVYTANNPVNYTDPSGNQFLFEYAQNLASKLQAAAPYVAIGMGTGAIFGAISAALCGGDVTWGIVSGAVIGGIAGVGAAFAPAFMAMTGVMSGAFGMGMAFNDMTTHGINACNFFQALMSGASIAGGMYGGLSGFSGGGFGPRLAGVTANGGVIPVSAQTVGVVGNTGVTTVAGTLGVLSLMMSGEGGEGGRDFASGETKHIDRIKAVDVEKYIRKHPWALTEPANGPHVVETRLLIARLHNSVRYLESIVNYLNQPAASKAINAINEGNAKIM